MLAAFLEDVRDADRISPQRLGSRLRMPLSRLAEVTRLHRNTLSGNGASPAAQERLGEVARIVARAALLAGDEGRAIIWFRHQPLSGFGDRTAEQLVADGHADVVLGYLDELQAGGYA
jgi:uncharacterized protein (DUF2384 family)